MSVRQTREARRFWPVQGPPLPGDRALNQFENRDLVRGGNIPRLVNRDTLNTFAPFARAATPGVIDEHPAHDLRGDTEEMGPILPVTCPLVDEPQVRLVNECGWLQGVAGSLAAKLARRNPAQLGIDRAAAAG